MPKKNASILAHFWGVKL